MIHQDGRILFMDPVTKGKKYMEFKASKDAVSMSLHNSFRICQPIGIFYEVIICCKEINIILILKYKVFLS